MPANIDPVGGDACVAPHTDIRADACVAHHTNIVPMNVRHTGGAMLDGCPRSCHGTVSNPSFTR
jgi:hypothetical protein